MRLRTLASAGIAVALAATLAACGGDDEDSAAQTPNDTASSADPNAGAPGTGDDAYKPDDKFVPGNNKITDIPARTVIYADFKIFPEKITAKAGEQWTQDNQDVATHNLTADKAKQKNGDISPDVMAGQQSKFKMPSKKGKYKVVCYYHQNMTATIDVK